MPLAIRRREILEQVARGELSPDQAAELLARLDVEGGEDGGAPPEPADAEPAMAPPPPSAPPRQTPQPSADQDHDQDAAITAVRLRSTCRAVTVIGDPDVRTAVVDGEHTATVEGDTFVIHAILDRPPGFSFLRPSGGPASLRARVRLGSESIQPLVVRMNPRLAFDGEMDAGSMTVRGVAGPIRGQVSAGALRVDDFDGPIELKVAAGAATARGRIDHGASRVECDAGKVTLRLTEDSSVTIRGRVNLGQLSTPDRVGDGEATLDISASLGSVEISVEDGR